MITFFILTGLFVLFTLYHLFILPKPPGDIKKSSEGLKTLLSDFLKTFSGFFKRKNILVILAFLLLYRLGESQLLKLASPFLLDTKESGGLALSTSDVGYVYGTVGIIALSAGGLLGGFLTAIHGLKYWIWWMLIAINIPNIVYVYLAFSQTSDIFLIGICVAVEQFGYGFGFTAFLLFLIYISEGEFKTSHYAIGTGFMALGMMLPGMISGWIQEQIGYQNFFIWVCISTIPAFVITRFISIDENFGKKITEGKSS
jgi:PAT family beta-lactamase induction signal transducer AmpG